MKTIINLNEHLPLGNLNSKDLQFIAQKTQQLKEDF